MSGVAPVAALFLVLAGDEATAPIESLDAPQAEAVAPAEPIESLETPPTTAPAHSRGRRVWLSGAATTGTAPRVTPRFGIGLAVDVSENLTVEAQVEAGVPAVYAGGPTPTAGYQLWPAAGATLALCTVLPFGPLRVLVCPVAQLEAVESAGVGVTNPGAGVAAWLALGIDARALVELGDRFFLHLALGERVALNRPSVVFQRVKPVFDAPIFSTSAEAGVGVRW